MPQEEKGSVPAAEHKCSIKMMQVQIVNNNLSIP